MHVVVDTLGHLLTLTTSPANEQDRAQVEALCHSAREVTDGMNETAFADQGYTWTQTPEDAHKSNVELIAVKRLDASRGFVLLPKRWVIERPLAWLARFRRLGRDLERLSSTFIGFHFVAACVLLLNKLTPVLGQRLNHPPAGQRTRSICRACG